MKSYNHLWEQFISTDNIILAEKNAGKGKRKNNKRHKQLREYRTHPELYVEFFRDYAENYFAGELKTKLINDGIKAKQREITIPSPEEVVLHNMIVNVLKPILMKGMYEHSYACIDDKGSIQAVKAIKKIIDFEDRPEYSYEELQEIAKKKSPEKAERILKYANKPHKKRHSKVKYCFKADIRKFFNSVNQDKLIERLTKIIRDKKFLNLLITVIRAVPSGLALGYTTSHWLANWFLTPLDHYIKEVLKVPYYFRFVDDIVLFDSSKKRLHQYRMAIQTILQEEYDLELKDNWQIFLISDFTDKVKKDIEYRKQNNLPIKTKEGRFLDFLGYKFHRKNCLNNKTSRITLRKSNALRIKRKARHIKKKGFANIYDTRQMVTYSGIYRHCNCFKWASKFVDRNVKIKCLQYYVSKFDKEQNEIKAVEQAIEAMTAGKSLPF